MRRWIQALGSAAVLGALVACGGGSGTAVTAAAATTLGGTAAVGAPIVGGTVNVTCAGGSGLSATTGNTGAWQVTVSGQTLPCAVRISGGTVNTLANGTDYHTIALSFGTANITPLTDLITANLAGSAPGTWFGALDSAALQALTEARVSAALQAVSTALGLTNALDGANPITRAFSPVNGDLLDDILEALANAGAAYADLLANAQTGNFTAPAGFDFQSALAAVQAAHGGSSGNCAAGQEALTYAMAASGGPHTDGQQLCFTLSTTTLAFSGKTLGNPTQNLAVSAPFSAYQFADGATIYEVVFNNAALHEINVSDASSFLGQFAASASAPAPTGMLEITVTVAGAAGPSFAIPNIPAPPDSASFCSALASDGTFAAIGTAGGGTLVVTNCSFANNVGTVQATLLGTIPYVVTYRYL